MEGRSRPVLPTRLWSTAVAGAVILTAGCASDVERAGVDAVRDTLPGGALRVRYAALPAPAAEPLPIELRIGALDGPPHEIFGDIRSIEADAEGNIYVLDAQPREIRVFDREGRYLRTLTRQGDGPGELSAANGMVLTGDGVLWIQDHGRWQMVGLDLNGREVGRVPMHVLAYGYVWDGTVDHAGRFWKPTSHSDEPRAFPPAPGFQEGSTRTYQKWYDPATEAHDSIFLGERTFRMYVIQMGGGGWRYAGVPFDPQPLTVVDPAGGLWQTSATTYRLARIDERGDTVLVVEAEVAPPPVTTDDVHAVLERMLDGVPSAIARRTMDELAPLAPAHRPVIQQLAVDDEGRLWVRRTVPEGEAPRYDVFSTGGDFLGAVQLGFQPAVYLPPRIRDGKLYALALDELEVHTVVRATVPALADGEG